MLRKILNNYANVAMMLYMHNIFVFGTGVLTLALIDALSKKLILYIMIEQTTSLDLTSFLSIVSVWNYGISFGIGAHYFDNALIRWTFSGIVMLVVFGLYRMFIHTCRRQQCPNGHHTLSVKMEKYGFICIAGGAVGNLYDRVQYGAVFDFISFHWKDWYFPAFNVADCIINIGCFMLIISWSITSSSFHSKNKVVL